MLAASYNIKAEVVIPPEGAEGMLVTQGGRFGGYGFYVLKGKPVYTRNMLDLERVKWMGREALSPGKHTLEFDFTYDGMGAATLTGVDDRDYQPPFKFTGELTKLTLAINRPKLTPEDIQKLKEMQHKNPASE